MATGAYIANPVGVRSGSIQETAAIMSMHSVLSSLPVLPTASPSRARAIVPRRHKPEKDDAPLALRRFPKVADHTSEDVLMRILQKEDTPMPLPAPFGRTICNLTLRLNLKKTWYKSEDCLFYGGRQLMDDPKVRDVVDLASASQDNRYLHVFVKAEDLQSVSVTSQHRRKPRPSALSRSLSRLSMADRSLNSSMDNLEDMTVVQDMQSTEDPTHEGAADNPKLFLKTEDVIHLIVKKSAHVSWQHVDTGHFELSVNVSETAGMVKERLSNANGLNVDKHALLYNGFLLDSNKPLSAYGVGQGAVLELVPLEPALEMPFVSGSIARSYPDGSPMLSSPAHSLFMQWQRANSGLKAGNWPSLASAGSGGSYFMYDSQQQVRPVANIISSSASFLAKLWVRSP